MVTLYRNFRFGPTIGESSQFFIYFPTRGLFDSATSLPMAKTKVDQWIAGHTELYHKICERLHRKVSFVNAKHLSTKWWIMYYAARAKANQRQPSLFQIGT